MRFMILVKATAETEAGQMPEESMLATMADYHEQLARAGVLLDASGLQSTSKGWRITYAGDRRTVTDGPFAETKELLAGFYLLEATDLNDAIRLATKIPPIQHGSIEVRPVRELDVGELAA